MDIVYISSICGFMWNFHDTWPKALILSWSCLTNNRNVINITIVCKFMRLINTQRFKTFYLFYWALTFSLYWLLQRDWLSKSEACTKILGMVWYCWVTHILIKSLIFCFGDKIQFEYFGSIWACWTLSLINYYTIGN